MQYWKQPIMWDELASHGGPRKVFCASLADVFECREELLEWQTALWILIAKTKHLQWQLLTKRPENIVQLSPKTIPQNVWIGVSVENKHYLHRIDTLREVDAKIRFVSYEPALGPIADEIDLKGIDWLIYGGESGPHYRSEDKQWARDMRAKCRENDVAFFHKQSAGLRTETGIDLDGEIIREFPVYADVEKQAELFQEAEPVRI